METVEPAPVPDNVDSNFCASAKVFTLDVCQVNTMLIRESTRPIQLSSEVLKRTPCDPSFSSSAAVGAPMAMTVPSFGETLNTWLIARKLPAPGVFFGTTVGLPGMCLPTWRAISRPQTSLLPPGG